MDDVRFENYIPEYALDDLSVTDSANVAQVNAPESVFAASEGDFDRMLDALLIELGQYGEASPEPSAAPDETEAVAKAVPSPAEAAAANDSPNGTRSAARHTILDANEKPEDEPELESSYLRRIARREALRAEQAAETLAPQASETDADSEADDVDRRAIPIIGDTLPGTQARTGQTSPLLEKLAGPLIRFLATQKARQKLREQEAASWPTPVNIRQTPELSPRKAAKYYSAQIKPLQIRIYILLFLTLVLAWIALRLPLAGLLRQNIPMQAAVSLVFLLTAMLCALDVVTTGIRQLFRFQPSMEALCAVSCLAACVDAALAALGVGSSLPFCALPAASLLAALWGEKLNCLAQNLNLSTAAQSRSGSILSAEPDIDGLGTLIRSNRDHDGIVRRSEGPDGAQSAYAMAAPLLLVLALTLGILSTFGQKWNLVFHNVSAYLAVCSNIACFLCFSLPYLMAVLSLRRSGAAIAGWDGCADIGKTRRVIITDSDMFPPGTIRLTGVNILEGANVEKVVSYTVSLLTASGSSVTEAFSELMRHRKYSLLTVDDFKCHDGGGFSAYIHSENVLVGSQGFLNLMGIRLPRGLEADNAICIAISNELLGVFNLDYQPVKGVQRALDLLLRGRTAPVFAIRDFNITPLMIQNLFRIPAIHFEFPSFRERYRLSTQFSDRETPPAAILLRPGIRCAVETAERGRKLYTACILSTALSLLATALGMLLLFLSFKNGNPVGLGAGRMLLYSVLWALPLFGIAYWTVR